MAGAVNIPIGLEITGILNSFKTASAATTQFTGQFKEQLGSLKASTEAPIGALSQLTRELAIAKRQIGDKLVVGATVSPELAAKFAGLNSTIQGIRGTLSTPITPFGDLNSKLSDTRSKIQDILAVGGQVPTELTNEFKQLSAQVDGINRSFNAVPLSPFAALNARLTETRTKLLDIAATGGKIPTQLTTEFRQLETQVANVNRSLQPAPTALERFVGFGDKLAAFGRTASVVSAGIVLLAGASFQSYAKINSLQLGLEGVTGSAAAAKEEFRQLQPIVRLPGLGLEEAVKGDVRLQAIGFSAREAKKDIAEIGNAIALTGGGKFELDSVLTQFTQMAGKAKVLSEDLKPILTASPAIAKAVKDLFGTVDSEQISAKLQAAGKGPKNFIDDLVLQLSKLDRVKGGPANALENLGDSVKLAQFQIGEAADKTFDLTGKINSLGDAVGGMAAAFAGAPGYVQTATIGLVGLATVIPPLAVGLGTLIKYGPLVGEAFRTGFAAASAALVTPLGTVLAVAAGIAALSYAIYQANKPLVELVDKTTLLSQVNQEAAKSIEAERSQIDRLLITARNEQLSKQARITAVETLNQIAPEYLSNLTLENINSAQTAEAIRKHAQAIDIRARARASEDKLVELYRKRDEVAAKPTKDFARPFAVFAEAVAPGQKPKAINFNARVAQQSKADKDAALKSIDDNIQAVVKLQDDQKARAVKFNVKLEPIIDKPTNYRDILGTTESQLKKDKARLKDLYAEIYEGNRTGKDVSAKADEYRTLKAQIDATKNATKAPKKPKSEDDLSTLKVLERIRTHIQEQMQEIRASGGEVANNIKMDLYNVENQIAKIQGKDTKLKDDSKFGFGDLIGANLNSEGERIVKFGSVVKETFADIKQYGTLGFYNDEIDKIRNNIQQLSLKNLIVPGSTIAALATYTAEVEKANSALKRAQRHAEFKRSGDLPHFDIGPGLGQDAEGKMRPLVRVFDDTKATLDERVEGLNSSITSGLQGAAASAATGFGELIGGMIAGTASLSDLPGLIGGIFADLAKTMGQALIAFGVAGIAAETFLKNPVTAIAAGVTLVALSGALRASLQSSVSAKNKSVKGYESGGLFLGESYIRVGESSKARAGGGEFVAPVNLGADLISRRIMKNLDSDFKRPQQENVNQGRQVGVNIGGQFEIRNDRLVSFIEAYLDDRNRAPREIGIVYNRN